MKALIAILFLAGAVLQYKTTGHAGAKGAN